LRADALSHLAVTVRVEFGPRPRRFHNLDHRRRWGGRGSTSSDRRRRDCGCCRQLRATAGFLSAVTVTAAGHGATAAARLLLVPSWDAQFMGFGCARKTFSSSGARRTLLSDVGSQAIVHAYAHTRTHARTHSPTWLAHVLAGVHVLRPGPPTAESRNHEDDVEQHGHEHPRAVTRDASPTVTRPTMLLLLLLLLLTLVGGSSTMLQLPALDDRKAGKASCTPNAAHRTAPHRSAAGRHGKHGRLGRRGAGQYTTCIDDCWRAAAVTPCARHPPTRT
jgi:hypothetical protein